MRIACPACSATYDVPDRLMSGARRRALRCARCGHSWTPEEPAPPPEPEPEADMPSGTPPGTPQAVAALLAPDPEPEPGTRPPPIRTPQARAPIHPPLSRPEDEAATRGARILLALGWAASIAVVAGLAIALVVWRSEVVEAWPPAARLFLLLGLDV